jgi:hypothetical protein
MRILLFEDYSTLHTLLAKGLRELGHQVTLVGNGNMFHDLPRDIDIRRSDGPFSGIRHMTRMLSLLPRFTGYDIVQLINPDCFGLKAEREYFFYDFLRRHNRKMVVGAFGCDWYWVDDGLHHKTFRYGDFYIGNQMRNDAAAQQFIHEYVNTAKGDYCRYVMEDADRIPTCLYEYQACYAHYFPEKSEYIPLPIEIENDTPTHLFNGKRLRFFIGIDKARSQYKGTDIMLSALEHIAAKHPDSCDIIKVEDLPYADYQQSMNSSDVMLDQLYSYTPSMNSLLAMSKGIIVVGGGEPEQYDLIHETSLRPIINVEPTYESVCAQLEWLIAHPQKINQLKADSISYVKKHHDYKQIALSYEAMYQSLLQQSERR